MKQLLFSLFKFLIFICFIFSLINCRGQISEKPPIHLNVNMDYQPKFNPQSMSNPQKPPSKTVPWGDKPVYAIQNRTIYEKEYNGKNENENWIKKIPSKYTVNKNFAERGRERYEIYCSVCHGNLGLGDGVISQYGFQIPSYHNTKILSQTDGEIFHTITYGKNTMSGYKKQISLDDRWAIVYHLRVLQRLSLKEKNK